MTKKTLEINERTYNDLILIGKWIETEHTERTGQKGSAWLPEDVINWLLGYAGGYNPQIWEIIKPDKKVVKTPFGPVEILKDPEGEINKTPFGEKKIAPIIDAEKVQKEHPKSEAEKFIEMMENAPEEF